MEELGRIILDALIGAGFSVAGSAVEIVVVIVLIVWGVVNRKLTNKQIQYDRTETELEKKVNKVDKDVKTQHEEIAVLANMIAIAFLSSTSTDSTVKKKIAAGAKQIEELSNFKLEPLTEELIKGILNHVPGERLLEKKEKVLEAAKKADDLIEKTSDSVGELVDKIDL